ncbi:MAG: PhoU domain-containing protein [Pseudomonadota bacterium]
MHLPSGLDENFRFMVLEVRKQLEETLSYLAEPASGLLGRIVGRDDYIDSMKGLIEEKSFSHLVGQGVERGTANVMRGLNTIASNLERIADFAVNVVGQTQYLADPGFLARYDYLALFDEVLAGLEMVVPALHGQDLSLALRICQCEFRLDSQFQATMSQIMRDLNAGGKHTGDLVTSLFIHRYLERMGDSLLNIGEALIFVLVGERLKIHQFEALQDTLAASGLDAPLSQVEFSAFWGNRSGCKVGAVADKSDASRAHRVVFKEGARAKIVKERRNIERWQEVMPGLPPRIFGGQENGGQASVLLEYLNGCTLQEVVLTSPPEVRLNATFLLTETLGSVWRSTLKRQEGRADHIGQVLARLDDVFRVHPRFKGAAVRIGEMAVPSLGMHLRRLQEVEQALPSPLTVFIHGDFNLNNIIYDHKEQRLHYLDLHRSADNDYVQDVSVFMASCFRMPVFQPDLRRRLAELAGELLAFARGFAAGQGDDTFEARLALGLIRSLITSTRFELNGKFAGHLLMGALYLMQRLGSQPGADWASFQLPEQLLHSLETL